jgi:hypothetical protein
LNEKFEKDSIPIADWSTILKNDPLPVPGGMLKAGTSRTQSSKPKTVEESLSLNGA